MTARHDRALAVIGRELRTIRRARVTRFVAGAVISVCLAVAWLSGRSGYIQFSIALLTPMEVLVPTGAAALGYRSILAERQRGELDIVRTFPVWSETYVGSVYIGRVIALLAIVIGSLVLASLAVPLYSLSPAGLTRTPGVDSPVYFLRFVVLTGWFAAMTLAVVIAVSALVRTGRRALTAALLLVVLLSFGLDLAIVLGLAEGIIPANGLPWFLAVSPASAYRGLVLGSVLTPLTTTDATAAGLPVANAVSLVLWTVLPLLGAGILAWVPPTYTVESPSERE
jgi:ABC-type transport system involved in multi-copper enzyme maturation permease subunit